MGPLKIIALVMLISLMLQSGMQSDWPRLRSFLTNYSLMGRALLANFIFVPLIAVLAVRGFHLREAIAAGILLMAVAPGVPFLPRMGGRKHGGSLGLAVALSVVMPAISIITAPLTARLLFQPHMLGGFPVKSTIITLVVAQLLPLIVGLIVASRAPQLAARVLKPLAVLIVLAMAVLLVLLAPDLAKAVGTVYGSYGTMTALLIVVVSLAIGWLLGGPEVPSRNTLALGTALRNPGLALVVATTQFPGTPVAAMVFTYFLVQVIVGLVSGTLFARSTKAPGAPVTAAPA